jgi:hypothetical protein
MQRNGEGTTSTNFPDRRRTTKSLVVKGLKEGHRESGQLEGSLFTLSQGSLLLRLQVY